MRSCGRSEDEIGPDDDQIGAEVLPDAGERVARVAVGVDQLQLDLHARDVLAGDRADLLAGRQLRRQHLGEGGREPRRVGPSREVPEAEHGDRAARRGASAPAFGDAAIACRRRRRSTRSTPMTPSTASARAPPSTGARESRAPAVWWRRGARAAWQDRGAARVGAGRGIARGARAFSASAARSPLRRRIASGRPAVSPDTCRRLSSAPGTPRERASRSGTGWLVENGRHRRRRRVAGERGTAGEHLVEDHAERKDVAALRRPARRRFVPAPCTAACRQSRPRRPASTSVTPPRRRPISTWRGRSRAVWRRVRVSITLPGLRSRCTRPCWWVWARASAICAGDVDRVV